MADMFLSNAEYRRIFNQPRDGDKFCLGQFEVDLAGVNNLLLNKDKIKIEEITLSREVVKDFFDAFPELLRNVSKDAKLAAQINLTMPLYVIQVYDNIDKQNLSYVVDGWKRIAKAFLELPEGENEFTFPAIFLSKKDGNRFITSGKVYKKAR